MHVIFLLHIYRLHACHHAYNMDSGMQCMYPEPTNQLLVSITEGNGVLKRVWW